MTRLQWDDELKGFFPKTDVQRRRAIQRHAEIAHARSDIGCPMIISDQLNDMRSMLDGQVYTSKRAYEKSVARAGCEIIGNENPCAGVAPRISDAQLEADIASDVKTAIEQVEAKL